MITNSQARTVALPGVGDVPVTFTDRGEGPTVLLLHGGGGPLTVDGFAELLSTTEQCHVIVPTHPGFNGTPRPDGLDSIAGLAQLYGLLLDALDLADVTVIGNSIGGWITAEMALLASARISNIVLVDAVGLRIDAAPIVDFFSLTMDQVFDLSYTDPDKFRIDPTALPDEQKVIMAANRATLSTYGGQSMADPSLLGRLPGISVPALVVWGAADRIVPVEHGQAYAHTIPDARLELIPDAGHLPQLETPVTLAALLRPVIEASPVQ